MSANDIIFINRTNFKVYYNGCADNKLNKKEDIIGIGRDLEEAVDIAQNQIAVYDGNVEYGINFFRSKRNAKL